MLILFHYWDWTFLSTLPNVLWIMSVLPPILIETDTIPIHLGYLWVVSFNPVSSSACHLLLSHMCSDQNSAECSMKTLSLQISGILFLGSSLISCTVSSIKVSVNSVGFQKAIINSRRLTPPPTLLPIKLISRNNYNAHLVYFSFLREGSLSYGVQCPLFWELLFQILCPVFWFFRVGLSVHSLWSHLG